MMRAAKQLLRGLNRYRRDEKGAAAVEFALVVTLLTVPVLNVIDLAMYAWDRMQLDNAAQVGAQAAWATCSTSANRPASPNSYALCAGMPAAVTQAVQSTSLGTRVTWVLTSEAYYCITTAGSLVFAAAATANPPSNCSKNGLGGQASDVPGDYVQITASFTFAPIFPAVSIASALTSPITRIAWMRLG
jgi:Flp pilus assembly protein TadG